MELTSKDIHNILLNVIKKEIEKKQSIRKREEDKSKAEIERIESIYKKLLEFEKKNLQELISIYPDYIWDNYSPTSHYLYQPLNALSIEYNLYSDPERCLGHYKNQVERNETKYFYGSSDTALLSYNDFHLVTNINIQSIKKYLKEMIDLNLIEQIHVIGGYEYRILGGI
jgi:hypothetical protein